MVYKKMKYLILIFVIFFSCKKKETKQPQTQVQSTVWCIYSNAFNNKAFLYCAKTEQEKNDKLTQYTAANIYPSVEIKSNCNECR